MLDAVFCVTWLVLVAVHMLSTMPRMWRKWGVGMLITGVVAYAVCVAAVVTLWSYGFVVVFMGSLVAYAATLGVGSLVDAIVAHMRRKPDKVLSPTN